MTRPRLARRAALAAVAITAAVALPSVPAGATSPLILSELLARSWQLVLETPMEGGPWTGGDPCLDLGTDLRGRPVIGPSSGLDAEKPTAVECDVPAGTAIFVTAFSSECSTLETEPYDYGQNWITGVLCALRVDRGITSVTLQVDGKGVRLQQVVTRKITFTNPEDGLLGEDRIEGAASAAHGWVALLDPLPVGPHEIKIVATGTYVGEIQTYSNTTTLHVA